jgi:NitT/TauT family transport system substrate-binding protein
MLGVMDRRLALAALPMLGLMACDRQTAQGTAQQVLRLGIDVWPGYLPGVLADELGTMGQAGIQLAVSFPGNTDHMLADFVAGRYDVIGVSLGDLVNITRGSNGVVVILVTDESSGGDAILARPGLALDRPGRLRIGTNLNGFGEVFLREYLRRRDPDPVQWELVYADAADVPRLLADKALDLGHTWEPYASQAAAAGARRVFTSASTPGLIPDVLVTTPATLQRRGPVLRQFVKAWLEAVAWWLANPAQAGKLLARRVPSTLGAVSLDGLTLMDLAANRRLMGVNQAPAALDEVIQRYSDYFLERGSVARPVVPASLLRPELLP